MQTTTSNISLWGEDRQTVRSPVDRTFDSDSNGIQHSIDLESQLEHYSTEATKI